MCLLSRIVLSLIYVLCVRCCVYCASIVCELSVLEVGCVLYVTFVVRVACVCVCVVCELSTLCVFIILRKLYTLCRGESKTRAASRRAL